MPDIPYSASAAPDGVSLPLTDGLAALVKNELRKDPFTGTVFVFRSRKADRLKLI